jgi:hypothetical protein
LWSKEVLVHLMTVRTHTHDRNHTTNAPTMIQGASCHPIRIAPTNIAATIPIINPAITKNM